MSPGAISVVWGAVRRQRCTAARIATSVFLQEFAPELKGVMETATALERQQILEELQACQVAVAAVRETSV